MIIINEHLNAVAILSEEDAGHQEVLSNSWDDIIACHRQGIPECNGFKVIYDGDFIVIVDKFPKVQVYAKKRS